MRATEFLLALEETWDKTLPPQQRSQYMSHLTFTESQLDRIYDKVVQNCKFRPKIADIYEAARDLGYLATPSSKTVIHRWEQTDCKLCGGEGRLLVFKERTRTVDDDGVHVRDRITRIFPYCKSQDYLGGAGEYSYLYRCSCDAGDADTIAKGIPKWRSTVEKHWLERVEEEKAKPEDFAAVKAVAEKARNEERERFPSWI